MSQGDSGGRGVDGNLRHQERQLSGVSTHYTSGRIELDIHTRRHQVETTWSSERLEDAETTPFPGSQGLRLREG
jgi:hypothetical protein